MTLRELNEKDVIQAKSGENLGRIDDIEFDTDTAQIKAVILHGRSRALGLLGHEEDLEIPWTGVKSIGTDVIMVEATTPPPRPTRPRRGLL